MTTRLKITWIGEEKQVETRFGIKPKNSIKAAEYNDNFLNYWVTSQTRGWKVGDVIEVEEVKPREYNGKTYYDIVMPKMANFAPNNAEVLKKLESIAFDISNIKLSLVELCNLKRVGKLRMADEPSREMDGHEMVEYPEEELDPNGINF